MKTTLFVAMAAITLACPIAAVAAEEDDSAWTVPTEQPGTEPVRREGFYNNAQDVANQTQAARTQTRSALKGQKINVAPQAQIREQCLIECKRLGYDEASAKRAADVGNC